MKNLNRNTVYLSVLLAGCAVNQQKINDIPAEDYAAKLKGQTAQNVQANSISSKYIKTSSIAIPGIADISVDNSARGQLKLVSDSENVTNIPSEDIAGVKSSKRDTGLIRDYQGSLDLGDPGVQASLWKESRGANDMLRDDRAWQAGDLITINVNENDVGNRQAKTDSKSENTVGAALQNFFGLAEAWGKQNKYGDTSNLIKASSTEEFKGQGTTNRSSQLTGKVSVMIAEVLPTGILRIEGKKIVTVNAEEQMMVLSGLLRVRDISSVNEVDSSRIANMRIDYYGVGTLGDAQKPGWASGLVKALWPF